MYILTTAVTSAQSFCRWHTSRGIPDERKLAYGGGALSLFAHARWISCRTVFDWLLCSVSFYFLTLHLLWYTSSSAALSITNGFLSGAKVVRLHYPPLGLPRTFRSHTLQTFPSMSSRPEEEPEQSQDGFVPHPNKSEAAAATGYEDVSISGSSRAYAGHPVMPSQTERYLASRPIESELTGQQPLPHVAGNSSGSEDLVDFGGSETSQAETGHSDATSAGPTDAPLPASPTHSDLPSLLSAEEEHLTVTPGMIEDLRDLIMHDDKTGLLDREERDEFSQGSRRGAIAERPGSPNSDYLFTVENHNEYSHDSRRETIDEQLDTSKLSDSDDAESIFSQASVASTATTLDGVFGSNDELISNLTSTLLCNDEVNPINITTMRDPGIGAERYRRNVRRLIKTFGKELKLEAKGPLETGTAQALQTRRISTHAARELVTRSVALVDDETENSHIRHDKAMDGEEGRALLGLDDGDPSSDVSVDSAEEDDGNGLKVDQELTQVRDFLLDSEAYASLKSRLLDFAHHPYESRISMAIGDTVIGESGHVLHPDSLMLMVQELSWVPTHLLVLQDSDTVNLPLLDRLKGVIEETMEKVNWWPPSARKHAVREGFRRLQWRTPGGTLRHVDVQTMAQAALKAAFDSAPAFLEPTPAPSAAIIERLNARFGTGEPSRHSSFRWYLGKLTPAAWKSPQIVYSSMALDDSHHRLLNTPSPDGSTAGTQSAFPASPTAAQRQVQSPGMTQSYRQHLHRTMSMSKGVEPLYLYLCIQLQSSQFECIRCERLHDDQEFYAKLKSTYDGAREPLRSWLSTWQYDHCEFYRFYKYDVNRGVPLEPGFPTDETLYDFKPRQPLLAFPHGPIPVQQFNDHYYSCGDAYWFSRLRGSRNTQQYVPSKRALDTLPKRTQPIVMEDGDCETLYGLLAIERRCRYRVVLYLILLNLVWFIFPPLWIFVWGHPSDLQNAFTPLQVALSVQQTFASWIGGT
jgi:hypothetical protein